MKLVYGVGVNDADYEVTKYAGNRQIWVCPVYRAWKGILQRCYSEAFQTKWPTYAGCTIDSRWLKFSVFSAWVGGRLRAGFHVDKDIIVEGNKLYSPHTCAIVPAAINMFLTDHRAARGKYPVGVCKYVATGKFSAHCNNPRTKKPEYLGVFDCPNKAHLAWATKKLEHALSIAAAQTDSRVSEALISRFTGKYESAVAALTSSS